MTKRSKSQIEATAYHEAVTRLSLNCWATNRSPRRSFRQSDGRTCHHSRHPLHGFQLDIDGSDEVRDRNNDLLCWSNSAEVSQSAIMAKGARPMGLRHNRRTRFARMWLWRTHYCFHPMARGCCSRPGASALAAHWRGSLDSSDGRVELYLRSDAPRLIREAGEPPSDEVHERFLSMLASTEGNSVSAFTLGSQGCLSTS